LRAGAHTGVAIRPYKAPLPKGGCRQSRLRDFVPYRFSGSFSSALSSTGRSGGTGRAMQR
jgi:hypothetical protein